jgi:orotidine-5'-phosphate decarboxylase
MQSFIDKLREAQHRNDSWVCVGLDPVVDRLPDCVKKADNPLATFGRAIVEATSDIACAFKPNPAFWFSEGPAGVQALQEVVGSIPGDVPIILDGKYADVGHTADVWARLAFQTVGADAATANPYLGLDALRPFLAEAANCVYLLIRTSNKTAPEVQDQVVADGRRLFEHIAELAMRWDAGSAGAVGLVVGATYPSELAILRSLAPDLPFLIPGIGSQGGNLEAAVRYGPTASGLSPVISSSRGIIYASAGNDFAEAARSAADGLRIRINQSKETLA